MHRLSELYLGATALIELPASFENLSGVSVINLSNCKRLECLPSSIFRLKCLKTLDVSGCSKLKNLPDDLGFLVGLQELHCTHTAIQTIPSSISLLKNLRHLSFRGCNGLSSHVSSSSHVQKPMDVNFQNLLGLPSLIMLDFSNCNISDGGILSDLGFLPSLEELNLDGNNFSNIPAESISRLTRLKVLALAGCRRLESFPELPPSIEKLYADECTSLMSIDQLTKYPMLHEVSLTNCHQLVKDKRHASMLDSLLKHMLKGVYRNDGFSLYISGVEIPERFTYKNSGNDSISVALPKNWYTPTFRGFGICVVFDLMPPYTLHMDTKCPKTLQGLVTSFRLTRHDGLHREFSILYGLGIEKPVGLRSIFLALVPLNLCQPFKNSSCYNPNNFIHLELWVPDKIHKDAMTKEDRLGRLIGLEEFHCTDTAIRTIPSAVSLLKNLKQLSLRGCNALGLQLQASSAISPDLKSCIGGCRRLESFPELPPSIEKLYADECTSFKHMSSTSKIPNAAFTQKMSSTSKR
ncbi:hypothetical protein CQW23_35268 [Capsicum baccatum]|uniref:Uncharacterized protein n=1 Tax=Capsicum baccatum TaxID=33114 RepID=A0A2G2UWI1_CAPBA|nr:hypothetical protein CQW23_35268 [Capsicum baccatum]